MSFEKSDIFSLGLTILQMSLLLTNNYLEMLNHHEKNMALKKKKFVLLKFKNTDYSEKLKSLIENMIEYDEENRPNI